MKTGLVIGKFYPFHTGHAHLISVAAESCDELVVAVCDLSTQVFTGAERAEWIREAFPQVRVIVVRDIMHDEDSELWARYTREFLGYAPDVVYTSENYGAEYARYLGAEHVMVDRERHMVPISATRIRENLYQNWQYLSAPVRAALARRVVLVGAESTGTTTLTESLARHYQTVWVPEFGRPYTEGKLPSSLPWETEEFGFIANIQNQTEDYYARFANRVLFCDTNSWATRLWHERYVGGIESSVDHLAAHRHYDLYVLTGDEIPFVQDGIRDGERIRHNMHQRFLQELQNQDVPYVVVSGSVEERTAQVVALCDQLLVSGADIFGELPKNAYIPLV